MTLTRSLELAPLSNQEVVLARDSGDAIAGFVDGDTALQITISRSNGEKMEATVPAFALRILAQTLSDIAQGKPVTLFPPQAELTTHQAAGMLRVSRPYLIKLLDEKRIPHRKIGAHRRIRYDDLRVYLDRENAARRETLAELAAYDQELGLDDLYQK